jgi:hypothetical protein
MTLGAGEALIASGRALFSSGKFSIGIKAMVWPSTLQ